MLICLDQRSGNGCGTHNPDNVTSCKNCQRPMQFALRILNPGTRIGTYIIRQLVGHGSFGAVYEASPLTSLQNSVAIKETFDSANIRSFHSEFQILHSISHPHLPEYYELFEENGNGYLVMDYVPGQSLEQIVQRRAGPLLETQVLGYAIQLCDVLSYLHGLHPPILHRDIKPANIRLTPEGVVKLVDFGLLKQGMNRTRSFSIGLLTEAYAPIEQYGAGTDQQSDIYSLGATLYHLVTGKEPITATDRISRTPDPLPPPRSLNPLLSQTFSNALVTALALHKNNRFTTAQQFQQALLGATSINYQGATPIDQTIPLTPAATVKVCNACGSAEAANEVYCQQCTAALVTMQSCRHCKKAMPMNASFCPSCGRKG